MARKFFYVCAGIFLLALSYHLGARSARATGLVECAGVEVNAQSAAVVGRHLWIISGDDPPYRVSDPVPGSSPVIACGVGGVILENGDNYRRVSGAWVLYGNYLSGKPTPVREETWGTLKSRYR